MAAAVQPAAARWRAGVRRGLARNLVVALLAGLLPGIVMAEVPAEATRLAAAGKAEEAMAMVYGPLASEADSARRVELARFAFDHDPDPARLQSRLAAWTAEAPAGAERRTLARLWYQTALVRRDFSAALAAAAEQPGDSGVEAQAAAILTLMGRRAEALDRLVALLKTASDAATVDRASALLAWLLWADGDARRAYEVVSGRTTAPALYLKAVLARQLGLPKDDQAARAALTKSWPDSAWTALAEPESDPSLQLETVVLLLTGIGPAAAGDPVARPAAASAGGSTAKSNGAAEEAPKAIKVGYFKDAKNAKALADRLTAKGFMAQVEDDRAAKRLKVLVLIRPGQDPQTLLVQLKEIGLEGFLVF